MTDNEHLSADNHKATNDSNLNKTENPMAKNLAALIWEHGDLISRLIPGKERAAAKFTYYFNYSKPARSVNPSHALALIQGRKFGCLRLSFTLPEETVSRFPEEIQALSTLTKSEKNTVDKDLFRRLREIAEEEAIALCVQNLREHLMNTPVGKKIVMSLDTSLRGGVKIAIIDGSGYLLDSTNLHLYPPLKDWYGSLAELTKLIIKYQVEWISIGAGAALKESNRLISQLMKMYPDIKLHKRTIYLSEAPNYSSLELIDEPFWRAVSIGRQLQDPLNELAKIDPLKLNSSPYREEVKPEKLKPALENLVQECIHAVKNATQDPRVSTRKNHTNSRGHNTTSHRNQLSTENKSTKHSKPPKTKQLFNTAMADAFAKLKTGEKS